MLDYVLNLIKLLFCRKIIIISNTLQMLSLVELVHAHKSIYKEFGNFIIICPYTNEIAFKKIKICHREFIKKNNLIINFQKKIEIKLLYFLFYFKKSLNLKIDQLILGNYYSNLSQTFKKISREILVLDDGTNILDKNHNKLRVTSKSFFFSSYDKKIFSKKNNYKKNNFEFLKNKFTHKKNSNSVLIIGKPFIELGFFKEWQYEFLIKYLKKKFKNRNLIYFPHPKESSKYKKKLEPINVIESNYPVELYFLKMKKIPKTIVTFNSSSVIPLKLIYKKLDIFNITFNIKFDVENKWHPLFDREDQIEHYFKSYLSIKSKELKIPK